MTASLLSRLQALTAESPPSLLREIDAEIALEVHPWLKDCPRTSVIDDPGWMTKDGRVYAPRYTASIDAVEPLAAGFYYLFAKGKTRPDEPLYGVQIICSDGSHKVVAVAEHDLPSVAFLIAIMRAKEPQP